MTRFTKGLGLPTILFASGILALATGVVGAYAVSNLQALTREQTYDQSHYASYSGIQWALGAVSQDPRLSSASANQPVGDLTFASNPELSCKVYIFSNLQTAATKCTQAPDGTIIPDNLIYVVSDTQLRNQSGPTNRSAQLSALCTPKQYYFNNALMGLASVDVLGTSLVDAYTDGSTYATPPSPVVPTEGSIATNNENNSISVQIGAGSTVDGVAYVGKNGNPAVGIDVQGTLTTNQKSTLQNNLPVKLDNLPGKSDVIYSSNLVVSGVQRFEGGKTYQVNGDLILGPGSQIVVDPNPSPQGLPQEENAFVFIKGNVTVNQGILGDKNERAERLQLYLPKQTGGHTFTMDNGSGSFLVCGPDLVAQVKNNSDIQGGVIAQSILLENSKMHFDTKLRNTPKGPMGWAVGGFDSDNQRSQNGGAFQAGPVPQANPLPGPNPGPNPVPGPYPNPAPNPNPGPYSPYYNIP